MLFAPAIPAKAESAAVRIGELEAQGFDVKVDRVGSAPLDQCVVTDVRNPKDQTKLVRVNGRGDRDTFIPVVVRRTITVSLDCSRGSGTRLPDDAQGESFADRVSAVGHVELGEDRRDVVIDGLGRQVQPLGQLGVGQARAPSDEAPRPAGRSVRPGWPVSRVRRRAGTAVIPPARMSSRILPATASAPSRSSMSKPAPRIRGIAGLDQCERRFVRRRKTLELQRRRLIRPVEKQPIRIGDPSASAVSTWPSRRSHIANSPRDHSSPAAGPIEQGTHCGIRSSSAPVIQAARRSRRNGQHRVSVRRSRHASCHASSRQVRTRDVSAERNQ